MSDQPDKAAARSFAELPVPRRADGAPRRIGVEIEFGGLVEADVARIVAAELGGTAAVAAPREWDVSGTSLGDVHVEFDTAFRDARGALADVGLDLARGVVPVEIVTDPLTVADLPVLDALCDRLREAGATGSRQGVFLGFGVHFNPEIATDAAGDIAATLTAYALIEDWLRLRRPIDRMRWALPFVDRYPPPLLDALAVPPVEGWRLDTLAETYLTHVQTRNHGLDMLPLLAHLRRERVLDALGPPGLKGARPTWHFRLPDCRIDEPDWSLAEGWDLWVTVEQVATRAGLLDGLIDLWRTRRDRVLPSLDGWAQEVDRYLKGAELAL